MKIPVLKCHGSGNDFVLIDEYNNNYNFSEENRILLVRELCDRSKLIGSDGVLFVQRSAVADARMRFFNTDSSEAEMCGNGVRCVGRYVCELLNAAEVKIETMKAIIPIVRTEEIFEGIQTFDVGISPVSFRPETLPLVTDLPEVVDRIIPGLSAELRFTALSIPNPHIVAVVDTFTDELIPIAEKANSTKELFPRGVNVSYVKDLGDSSIFVLTYERGVGVTNSCGTAMSASSLVTCLLGLNRYGELIRVFNKGGMVNCLVENAETPGKMWVHLIGNATYVFSVVVDFDFAKPSRTRLSDRREYPEESEQYARMAECSSGKLAEHDPFWLISRV